MKLHRIERADRAGGASIRLVFADGVSGVVDLEHEFPPGSYALSVIASSPDHPSIAPGGRALVWADADGEEVDLDAETLHSLCEAQRATAE